MAVDARSNESPLSNALGQLDLDRAVVTLDAMHTQTDTATAITAADGDYVFTVKANMPTLHGKLKKVPWKDMPAYTARTTDRGRRVTRTITITDDWISSAISNTSRSVHIRRTRAGSRRAGR